MAISTFRVSGKNPHSPRDPASPRHAGLVFPLPHKPRQVKRGTPRHLRPTPALLTLCILTAKRSASESTAGSVPPRPRPSRWATAGAPCALGSRNVYFASAGLQGNYREPNPQPRKSDFIRTPKGDTSGPRADRRHHGGEVHTAASGDITVACV